MTEEVAYLRQKWVDKENVVAFSKFAFGDERGRPVRVLSITDLGSIEFEVLLDSSKKPTGEIYLISLVHISLKKRADKA